MYTNIKTTPALEDISSYLWNESNDLGGRETTALIEALHFVFKHNYFKFGDTTWQPGTAMGISPAPPWATIFYAFHEKKLVPRWKNKIIFYKCFLDDVIGTWLTDDDPIKDAELCAAIATYMNSWFSLQCECTKPSTSINFMDLTITIVNNHIQTTLFEKA